jgi:hypothetical protein
MSVEGRFHKFTQKYTIFSPIKVENYQLFCLLSIVDCQLFYSSVCELKLSYTFVICQSFLLYLYPCFLKLYFVFFTPVPDHEHEALHNCIVCHKQQPAGFLV